MEIKTSQSHLPRISGSVNDNLNICKTIDTDQDYLYNPEVNKWLINNRKYQKI